MSDSPLKIRTLREAGFHLKKMARYDESGMGARQKLCQIAAWLQDERGLKAIDLTLRFLTRDRVGHNEIPLVSAANAVAETRRRLAEATSEERISRRHELSRLRVTFGKLEREIEKACDTIERLSRE